MATIKMCDICKSIKTPILNYYLPKPISFSSGEYATFQSQVVHFRPQEYDVCEDCAAAICRVINGREEDKQ